MRSVLALPRLLALGAVVVLATATGVTGSSPSLAAVPSVPFAVPQSDPQALQLLERAYRAETSVFYEGDAVVSVDGSSGSGHVVHIPGRGTSVTTPAAGQPVFEPDASLGDATLQLLVRHYAVQYTGTDTKAGRPAWQLTALRDDGSVAARFWVDQSTAVVLARTAYDGNGRAYDDMEFVRIVVGAAPSDTTAHQDTSAANDTSGTTATSGGSSAVAPTHAGALTLPALTPAAPAQRPSLASTAAGLRHHGWHVTTELPGGFQLYEARVAGTGTAAVLHLSYTDGLCSLSLFEQRGRLAGPALSGWHESPLGRRTVYVDDASPQRLAWQGRDLVFALISDTTKARVAAIVAALPAGAPRDGVLDRMERGFTRLGSWFDPFH